MIFDCITCRKCGHLQRSGRDPFALRVTYPSGLCGDCEAVERAARLTASLLHLAITAAKVRGL